MKINDKGLQIIKDSEGLRLQAYKDPGKGILTIGYGHTGPDVYWGMHINELAAEMLLRQDIERFEEVVDRLVTVPLNINQFSALVSFVYNLGEGAFYQSPLLHRLNQGDYAAAARKLPLYKYAGGKVLNGLITRRAKEKKLFEEPVCS